MSLFLGVDTSAYTTSLSLCSEERVIINLKAPVFVAEGMRGSRQSDALFSHIKNLPGLFDEMRKYISEPLTAVGVSEKPRDVEGSYMPVFLSGVSAASAVSGSLRIPLYRFSHQRGHIAAALYSSGQLRMYGKKDFIAFHMSGGTSEVLRVSGEEISLIGGTADLTAGQLIDRCGVLLGIGFPCGAGLEALAMNGKSPIILKPSVEGLSCHFSGAENKIGEFLKKSCRKEDIAAFTFDFVIGTLDKLTGEIVRRYGDLPLLYSGGVMSSSIIRRFFENKYGAYFAEPEFSADNAAGIALLTELKYKKEHSL